MTSRLNDTEEWISDLEDSIMGIKSKEEIERQIKKKEKHNLQDLWDNRNHASFHVIGSPEGK